MNLPTGYEPFRVNTIANDAVVGILCRRPDGGVSDIRAVLPNPTTYGICPSCGRDMKANAQAVFSCSAGHVTVLMTTNATTALRLGEVRKASEPKPVRRTVKHVRRSGSFPPITATTAQTYDAKREADIAAAVDALMSEVVE